MSYAIRMWLIFIATLAWGLWLYFKGKEKGRRERFGKDYMIVGEAQSHCFQNTIKDIKDEFENGGFDTNVSAEERT